MGFLAAAAPFIPSVIGAAGNILGGLIGKSGAEKTNQKQIDMTYDLTKNKHKYAMEDLKQSGLNPLLSVTTPSSAGSAPKLDNPNKQLGESVGAAANSAMSLATQKQALENLKAENHRIKAQAGYIHQQTIGQHIDNDRKGMTQPLYDAGGDIIETVVDAGRNLINSNSAKTIPPQQPLQHTQTAVPPVKEFKRIIKSKADIKKYFGENSDWGERPKMWEPNFKERWKVWKYVESLKDK